MAGNFIKIDRKILKWEWWSDINTFRLFMYMLISAYWKDGNYKGKIIERGSFPSSISELSKETNLSVMEIRTSLKHLQLTGEITSNLTNNQQTDNILLTNSILKESKNERTEEIKEDKNAEKDITNVISKKKSYYPDDELLDEAFNEYVTMRKRIKKPICTDKALHRAMNTLEKLSGGDNDLAIKILNQSVDHCWQGLFELKEDNSNKQGNQNFNKGAIDWDNV